MHELRACLYTPYTEPPRIGIARPHRAVMMQRRDLPIQHPYKVGSYDVVDEDVVCALDHGAFDTIGGVRGTGGGVGGVRIGLEEEGV